MKIVIDEMFDVPQSFSPFLVQPVYVFNCGWSCANGSKVKESIVLINQIFSGWTV
jgi:hypothetical protein